MKPEHFPDMPAALAAADTLMAHQRSMIADVVAQHPDIVVGDPMLDQFWYAKHLGIQGKGGEGE